MTDDYFAGPIAPPGDEGTGAKRVRTRRGRLRRTVRWTVWVTVAALVCAVTFVAVEYSRLSSGIHRSGALDAAGRGPTGAGAGASARPSGTAAVAVDTNVLVIGLDSRLDENGKPLPESVYRAMHTGDSSVGGENANVLMLVHLPAGGGKATAVSIPRDDYVSLPGCPDGQCHAKIKEAYGLAFDEESRRAHGADAVQQERDAGRRAEIAAVTQLLGPDVTIDHFVEVTMIAFYQFAQVVQPITVCLAGPTSDTFSGAQFQAGRQQISAEQAIAFVRQRRDTSHTGLDFTDLDRERRQQAFISSVAYQLEQAGTLANPFKIVGIVNVAKANIAIDNRISLLDFARLASRLTGGRITFYTLPILRFGTTAGGQSINVVDPIAIRRVVSELFAPQQSTLASPASGNPTARATHAPSGHRTTTPTPIPTTQLYGLAGGGVPCVK